MKQHIDDKVYHADDKLQSLNGRFAELVRAASKPRDPTIIYEGVTYSKPPTDPPSDGYREVNWQLRQKIAYHRP